MIESFSVENFLSFSATTIISFKAGSIKEFREDNTATPHYNSDDVLLKSIGIFGANGSGKSNIIKALSFMKDFVLGSSKESNSTQPISIQPFLLSTHKPNSPSTFEITFHINNIRYRYGFRVTTKEVDSEWLFIKEKRKEEDLFIRAKQEYSFSKEFKSGIKDKLDLFAQFTRPNALFASVLSQFNEPLFVKITNWFDTLFVAHDISHLSLVDYTASLMSTEDYRTLINRIIENSDLGIKSVKEKIKEEYVQATSFRDLVINLAVEKETNYNIATEHQVFESDTNIPKGTRDFDLLKNESLGTQKFFGILGPILSALKEKKILIIDEIDARLHSHLVEQLVSLFNSQKYNPNGAQLIFTSHNTNLIKHGLRRDQMVFAEKDHYGACSLNSLYVKDAKVRSDATFDKDYLLGKYGGIPKINIQLGLFDE